MIKIIKNGVKKKRKPTRKFKCGTCCCKFKTDEYSYTVGWNHKVIAYIECPQCNELLYINL